MANRVVDINFDTADLVIKGVNELSNELTEISSLAKNIDVSSFSRYSSNSVSSYNDFITSLTKINEVVEGFGNSFDNSVELYRELYNETQQSVNNKFDNPDATTTTESDIEGGATNTGRTLASAGASSTNSTRLDGTTTTSSGNTIAKIDTNKQNEIKDNIGFYFNYPSANKTMRVMSEDKLRESLEAQGATKTGDNTYQITMDGKKYSYNVKTGQLKALNSGEDPLTVRFFATNDTKVTDITNTVTIVPGSGTRSLPEPLQDLKINKNSLVIYTYGNDSTPRSPQTVSGSTRVGMFMTGNKTKNSFVGYSLGGMAGYSAIAKNPGLYEKLVTVNSAAYSKDCSFSFIKNNASAFKDVEIIMVEARNDSFVNASCKTIQYLTENGVPSKNIHVYTNDPRMASNASKYIPSKHVTVIDDGFATSHKGWSGHNHGFSMLVDINIFNYLTKL